MEHETVLGEYLLLSGSSRFRDLMPCFEDLLKKTDLTPGQLEGIAVAIGPGSFTGIRVGLALAKGLSQGLALPIVGVSTLAALASQIPYAREDICPVMSSRKGEVFAALFKRDRHHHLTRLEKDASLSVEQLAVMIKRKTIVIGNDFTLLGPLVKQYLGKNALVAPPTLWSLRASSIGALGAQSLQQGHADNVSELVPVYLRGADIRPAKTMVP
jgi:tRNA threonylcarbamoyladenosine biosynthesis protein TsaB